MFYDSLGEREETLLGIRVPFLELQRSKGSEGYHGQVPSQGAYYAVRV